MTSLPWQTIVSKMDNVMHLACLVKQASLDSASDLSVYYSLGMRQFVFGAHKWSLPLKYNTQYMDSGQSSEQPQVNSHKNTEVGTFNESSRKLIHI